jgi:hypothetical protein
VTSLTSSTTFGPVFVFVLSLNEKMVFPRVWLAVPVSQGRRREAYWRLAGDSRIVNWWYFLNKIILVSSYALAYLGLQNSGLEGSWTFLGFFSRNCPTWWKAQLLPKSPWLYLN